MGVQRNTGYDQMGALAFLYLLPPDVYKHTATCYDSIYPLDLRTVCIQSHMHVSAWQLGILCLLGIVYIGIYLQCFRQDIL